MKIKSILIFIIAIINFATSCINAQTINTSNKQQNEKILIAYFSKTGNTKQIAEYIQSLTGGDLLRIETKQEYPQEYRMATEAAKQEKEANARPVLKTKIDNINEYDVIFIGFPIWWSYTPMAIATFLESYDLSGKTIIPFCTHGGGGVGEAFNHVKKLTPNSIHSEGFITYGSRASTAKPNIERWLQDINIIK